MRSRRLAAIAALVFGTGGLALVYTRRDTPRGYDLVTIYDDDD